MKNPARLSFAQLPTPIEDLPRLSEALHGPLIQVKRDDQTGLAFGGNKTRKLEFLLADAQAQGARTIITAGAVQSNHCRQTAAAAARMGLECMLVLSGEKPPTVSGNLLLDTLLGAEIHWARSTQREQFLEDTFKQARDAGRRPYLIPYGGSNPIGACAYAFAMQEMMQQVAGAQPPDWIVFATSSGGTQAGLVAGARLFAYDGQILGISVDQPTPILSEKVARLANETSHFLGVSSSFALHDIQVNADYIGKGYGVMGAGEREAIRLFAKYEGLMLDPVYTGRAAAGLIDLIRKGFFKPHDRVLFWHTGGTPAIFASGYQEKYEIAIET
jgi:D-cysteine desulfhydrase family pyridoxal phosphate-dependent enzyme